jgi:hypothetical protein
MADVQILASQSATGHLDFVVPGSQELILKAIKASYDGSGAAGSFIPAVQVISPAGEDAGTYTAVSELAAGDSADVSFGPFLVGLGDAIRFDVDNRGGTLRVTTVGQDGVTGDGIRLDAEGGGQLEAISTGGMTLSSSGGNATFRNTDSGQALQVNSNGRLTIEATGTDVLAIDATGGGEIQVTDTAYGIRVRSGDNVGYPFNLTNNAVTLRAGSESAPGAIEISAFEEAAADRFSMVLVGNWTFGSPAVPHHGVNVLIRSTAEFSVSPGDGTDYLRVDFGGQVLMPALPAVNPGGTGKLWNNGGVVNIT